jgi:hypothetical protein
MIAQKKHSRFRVSMVKVLQHGIQRILKPADLHHWLYFSAKQTILLLFALGRISEHHYIVLFTFVELLKELSS